MRRITDHVVPGDMAPQLEIHAIDESGPGGAHHEYVISWGFGLNCGIVYQKGPIKEVGVNGISNEALLAVVIDRLRSFQAGPFSNKYNAAALVSVEDALADLKGRTVDRIQRGVEGQSKV